MKKETRITQHVNVFRGPLVNLLCNEMTSISRNSKRNLCSSKVRKRGFSVATVAKGKTRYTFLSASASCLQFVEALFVEAIFPQHTQRYAKNCSSIFFKMFGKHFKVSRLIPFCLRSLLLCLCTYTGAIANREVSYEELSDQNRLQSLAGSTFSVFSEDMLVIIPRRKIKEIRVQRRFKTVML